MNFLSPVFNEQTFDANGDPLVGGQLYTYAAGTSTPLQTYTTQNGSTQQSNPIILNARGEPPNPIWLLGSGQEYKFQLYDANNNLIRTIDDVGGINDVTASSDEWTTSSLTPTYISATSFSLVGDQTLVFSVGRRIRSENSGGTIYSTIASSSFGAGITTIVVRNDSGILDSGISLVAYGVLSPVNPSTPNSQAVRQAMGLGWAVDIASAATINLSTRTGLIARVTGTTTTTAVTMANGDCVVVIAVGAWPINIAGVLTYTCTAGDVLLFTKDGNGTTQATVLTQVNATETRTGVAEIATQTEVNALTDDARIVTPLKLGNSYSIDITGTDGYIKMPSWLGGWTIQWGRTGNIASNSNTTVTLPITFTSNILFAVAGWYRNASPTSGAPSNISCEPLSASSIRVYNSTSSSSEAANWIAIGY